LCPLLCVAALPVIGIAAALAVARQLQPAKAQQAGTAPSDDTVWREQQRLGYVWERFRYVLPADPEVEKNRLIRRCLR
jgi:hypothetical protein